MSPAAFLPTQTAVGLRAASTGQRVQHDNHRSAAAGAVRGTADSTETPATTSRGLRNGKLSSPIRADVWCEALVVTGNGTETGRRAERRWDLYAAPSPREAIRWMRRSVQTVTPTLGRLQRGYVLDHWVHGPASLADYADLCRGRGCSLTVYRDGAEITWRARPVRFLPVAAIDGRPPSASQQCRTRTGVARAP